MLHGAHEYRKPWGVLGRNPQWVLQMHMAREVPWLRIGGDECRHGVWQEGHPESHCLVAEFHCVETEGLKFQNGFERESQKLCWAPEFHQKGQP